MQIPLQLTFEGIDPSDAARVAIEREVERLEKHNHRIIGCRVTVIAPSHAHQHGSGFQIHIWLTIPPHENIVVTTRHLKTPGTNMSRSRSRTRLPPPDGKSMISRSEVKDKRKWCGCGLTTVRDP
jgi:hypothetical protein